MYEYTHSEVSFNGAAFASAICAQGLSRQAVMTGSGSPDRGKCTIEVVVDGTAQVEIRGSTATLRDLNGRQPQWRRFECTGAMPPTPRTFGSRASTDVAVRT
jgi:hypothetical protein